VPARGPYAHAEACAAKYPCAPIPAAVCLNILRKARERSALSGGCRSMSGRGRACAAHATGKAVRLVSRRRRDAAGCGADGSHRLHSHTMAHARRGPVRTSKAVRAWGLLWPLGNGRRPIERGGGLRPRPDFPRRCGWRSRKRSVRGARWWWGLAHGNRRHRATQTRASGRPRAPTRHTKVFSERARDPGLLPASAMAYAEEGA